ncbi:hypothetical protein [Microcoleus sp. herbarium12]|uniref:hypothetical protein n=1 Tax=Microcoleus sp. herbarium12 TaxID=3055437 RepID=UPI002FD33BD5
MALVAIDEQLKPDTIKRKFLTDLPFSALGDRLSPQCLLVLNQAAWRLLPVSVQKAGGGSAFSLRASEALLCVSAEDSWERMLSPDRANDTFIEDY